MSVQIKGVQRLDPPVWFYTGLKMKDGTAITVAAYDTKQLVEYKEKKSYLGTFDKHGLENFVMWQMVDSSAPVPEVSAPDPGITMTGGRRRATV